MGEVASGNNGFLTVYKFAVQLKFGDSSLLSLQVSLKVSLGKRPGKEKVIHNQYIQFTSIHVTKCWNIF